MSPKILLTAAERETARQRALHADSTERYLWEIIRGLIEGAFDTSEFLDDANTVASADYIEVVKGGAKHRISYQSLLVQLANELGTVPGGGGASLAPVMPDSASFVVPAERPNGAIVGYVTPLTAGLPAPTFTMTPVDGLACRPDTGDIYVTDATALMAALAIGDQTTALTATNTVDFDSTTVTLTLGPDYEDLPSAYATNLVMDFDMLDNRQVTYDATLNVVTLLEDKSPQARDATNSQDKIGYVLNSGFGAGKPAIRGTGAAGATTGLFFNQNPVWRGIRLAAFVTQTLVDRLTINIDQSYNINPSENARQVVNLDFAKDALLSKPCLVTAIAEGDTLTYRLNGTEIDTVTLQSYNQPAYPVIAFFLFYVNATTGYLFSVSALGQSRSWKDGAVNGDICRLVQYLNAVAA